MSAVKQEKARFDVFDTFASAAKSDGARKVAKEAEVNAEGMAYVEKVLADGGQLPLSRVRESIGVGAWDSLMMDAMNKRLLKGWSMLQQAMHWRKIVSNVKNVTDFRTQYAIQTGEFTTLDQVAARAPYNEVEFTDDRISYTVAKYGQVFGLSFEAMTNDDLGAFGRIVEKFGSASQRTVEKFIFTTMLNANPTIYDASALFVAGHSNDLGAATPLNHDNLEAGIKLMANQTDIDGNQLDLVPRFLIVHPDDKFQAMRLLKSSSRPATANNDVNVHEGSLELIATSRVTSGRWYLMADPGLVDTYEVGFLGGRQEPEIFEESPDSGHAFAYDERRWKCRLVFGAAILDYRGFVRANV
jgi:hypothetical protein